MKNVLFLVLLGCMSILKAEEVPLEKMITVDIALGEWAIFDFPFDIKKAQPTSFRSKYNIEKVTKEAEKISGGTEYLNAELPPVRKKKPTIQKRGSKTEKPKKESAISMSRGKHTISIYPKKYGETNVLLWGHKGYPITLKVRVIKKKKGPTHLKFIDNDIVKEEAKTLEKTAHEKMLVILTKYLYKRETPKGYVSKTYGRTYKKGRVRMKLLRSIVGYGYRGEEWILSHTYKQTKKFYEEIFYTDGVYSVSFEDNILRPKEKTRMFIIRKVD